MSYPDYTPIARYVDYTPSTWIIPKMYWDAFSQEQRYHALCKQLCKLISYADQLGIDTKYLGDLYTQLVVDFEKFKESGFDDYYIQKIYQWIDEHMEELISHAVKQVYFGLNDEGYFVAYIPESWSDITFDTGHVFGRTDYGRLILRFEADHAIDNTYSYSLGQRNEIEQLIADLEVEAHRTDAAFDTLFTNLDEEVVLNGNI